MWGVCPAVGTPQPHPPTYPPTHPPCLVRPGGGRDGGQGPDQAALLHRGPPAGGGHTLLPAHAGVKDAHPWAGCAPLGTVRGAPSSRRFEGWVRPGCCRGCCHGWLHPAGGGHALLPAHAGVKGAHPWVLVAGQAGGAAPPRPSTFVPPLQVQALGERRAGGPPLSLSFSFLSLHPPFCLTISTATTALCAGCRRSPPSSSRRWTTWCRR